MKQVQVPQQGAKKASRVVSLEEKRRFGYRDIEETQEEDCVMTEAETEGM